MDWSSVGIVAPPFQLTPDARFYFDSVGHRRAIDALRGGLEQASGFVIVSGEIGAGKTTLVRTLVADLDREVFVVSQVVSTQLQSDDLMLAALIGFGAAREGRQAEGVDLAMRRFLSELGRQGRRALLIVDEAQHLERETIERLCRLAAPERALALPLQVWMVGQPELRQTLHAVGEARLHRAVVVSCDIGPIERAETGAYVEHRLRKVGWSGKPQFGAGAYDEIYWRTRGIPRRINLLCNRLLISQFLASTGIVDRHAVVTADQELRAEVGEIPSSVIDDDALPVALAPSTGPPHPVPIVLHDVVAVSAPRRTLRPARIPSANDEDPHPIVCVAAGFGDHVRAAALLRALRTRAAPVAASLLRVHDNDALGYCGALYAGLDVARRTVCLGAPEAEEGGDPSAWTTAFAAKLDALDARALVVFDSTPLTLACATEARVRDVPVVHAVAGRRALDAGDADLATWRTVEATAGALFAPDAASTRALVDDGLAAERVHCSGSLAVDSVRIALDRIAASRRPRKPASEAAKPYGLVVLGQAANTGDRGRLTEIVDTLRDVARAMPLVWPIRSRLHAQLKRFRLEPLLATSGIRRIPAQLYVDYVGLLQRAACVLTDSWTVQEEAGGLGIPCLVVGAVPGWSVPSGGVVPVGTRRTLALSAVWEVAFGSGPKPAVPPLWDGSAGARIADVLADLAPARGGIDRAAQIAVVAGI
jgi:type II secretory pathway predicted ATPase ExeA/UDP-N-acetylglucosamine 2-epimerase